jgi:hypothetical protein
VQVLDNVLFLPCCMIDHVVVQVLDNVLFYLAA